MQEFEDSERIVRCAIYTRKSTTYRLDSDTNSLVTQRQVCSAYITSQQYKGWVELPNHYDDGGQTGGSLERPALTRLMRDIEHGKIDTVVIYKIDRLTRSLVDFVRLIDLFEERRISLVSISQAFDTSDSMGRSRVAKSRKKPESRAKETTHYLAKLMRDELGRPIYLDIQRKPDGRSFTYYSSTDARWTQEKMIRAYRTHAGRFDQLIDATMTEFMRDRVRLRRALKEMGLHGRELEKLAERGEEGARRFELTPSEAKEELLHALIIAIELSRDHIDITVRPYEIRRFLEWDQRTTYHARPSDWPLTDARSEFRIEISAVSNEKWSSVHFKPRPKSHNTLPNPNLRRLIRSAEKAQMLMRENRELGIADLAKLMDVRVAQFGRLLQLNYLAPDIVAAILDGTQPLKLERADLLSSNLPTDWALQRSLLGFPPLRKEIVKNSKGGMLDERDIKGMNALE